VCQRTIEVEEDITHISFSDEQHLNVNQRVVDISSEPLENQQYSVDFTHELLLEGDWIARGNQKIMWLPPDYRVRCSANYKSTLALGHANGYITFVSLS
jgi:hypothetical protein